MRKVLAWLMFFALVAGASAQERPELLLKRGHSGNVKIVAQAVSPDTRFAYTVGDEGAVKVWSLDTKQVLRTIYDSDAFPDQEKLGEIKVTSAVFSPSLDWVATIDEKGLLRRFSLPEGDLLDSRQTALSRGALELHTDGISLFLLSLKSLTKVDVKTGESQEVEIDRGHCMSLSAELGRIAMVHKGVRTLSLLEASDLSTIVSQDDFGIITGLAFSSDGQSLAVVSQQSLHLLEASDLSVRASSPPATVWTQELEHKPLWVGPDLYIYRDTVGAGEMTALLRFDFKTSKLEKVEPDLIAQSASVTPDSRIFFGHVGGKSQLYDPLSGESQMLLGDAGGFTRFALHPESRHLFTGNRRGEVLRWSPEDGRVIQRLEGLRNFVSALELSPDGSRLLGSEYTQGRIVCWDAETGKEISRLDEYLGGTFGSGVQSLHWVDSKSYFYTAQRKPLRLISADTGEVLNSWEVEGDSPVAIAVKDGRVLASYSRGTVLEADINSKRDMLVKKFSTPLAFTEVTYGSGDTVFLMTRLGGRSTLYKWDSSDPDSELVLLSEILGDVTLMEYRQDTLKLWVRDGRVLSLDDNGKILSTLQLADRNVWGLPVVTDDTIVTIADDYKLCFYNATTGERLGRLVSVRNNEGWVALEESGSFDGNDVGLQTVQFSLGDELYGVDQFLNQYLRPGLLADLLPGSKKMLRTAAPLTSSTVKTPPEVRILEPTSGSTATGQSAQVKLQVSPRGSGASEPLVYHNGHKLPQSGLQKVDDTTFLYEVKLVEGLNEFQASAFDGSNQVESRRDRVRVKAPDVQERPPRLHLLSVGIDAYGSDLKLEFADEDAQSISELFQSDLYTPGERLLLKNQDATHAGISEAVAKIAESAEPQDAFVLYLAGHGTVVSDTYYFLPQDVQTNSDQELEESALSSEALSKMLASVPATKQLLVLDTCRAGKFLKGAGEIYARSGLEEVRSHNLLSRTSGTFLIAATKEQDYAFEIPQLGHGILTFSVLEAMGAKEQGQATTVTANELLRAVSEKVPELSEKYHGTRQSVVQDSSGQDFPVTK